MNKALFTASLAAFISALAATPSLAGAVAPAPLLAAGLPGLGVLAVAGGGYLAVRALRRRRD
ncbi:MAG TPA: hypothetical protein VGI30_00205 [Caulobacteraceae bacterium]|jgi:hypothetical protein